MKILAIEASGLVASVALIENDKLVAEYTINNKLTHSQTIMPMIEEICNLTELELSTIDYIACSSGPGSFTGLRIGAATAKGLALGLNIPVIPVPTLDALAYNIFDTQCLICPIMDARRQQVYTAIYEWKEDDLCCISDPAALPIDEIIQKAESFGRKIVFLGDGVPVYRKRLLEQENFVLAPANCNMQKASSVAALGQVIAKKGNWVKGDAFAPIYLRKSQAERELEEKNRHSTEEKECTK
ncbi:MAG: tRNA (adenosine(37)-N6)-threonylcarbamoyltransferase complex dimerization subunit type 1 TsaB [Clostridiales bacterium]|nr:tRNA (adenosine(37)-N6)-threonylcarbamoyltransferase complex dimerization subunit type 1 TsaB [Clostridiales bacterium]